MSPRVVGTGLDKAKDARHSASFDRPTNDDFGGFLSLLNSCSGTGIYNYF